MSKKEPSWREIMPPKSCEKCGEPYSVKNFEMRNVDADITIMSRQYRSWCKKCDSEFMDEGEQV